MRLKCSPPACTLDLRCPRCWSIAVLMMSSSKSDQVCIRRFHRSSMSWIFVSYTCCCTTPKISKFRAHDDPGSLWWSYYHLMQFSFVISRSNITFSVFWLSQGSVATLIRWGGLSWYCHVYCSFVNLTVKTALKSVDFRLSYRQKISWLLFYGPRCRCSICFTILKMINTVM